MSGTTGQFKVKGGRLFGPDGKQFIFAGINVGSTDQDPRQLFPGITCVRFAIPFLERKPAPSYFTDYVNRLTGQKIVVVIEDHPWPIPNAYTGTQLQQELQLYAALAQAFKGNPYVHFGSQNEVHGPGGPISAQHVAMYKAIRDTGNQSMIWFEAGGGAGDPGQVGYGFLTDNAYKQMTNVGWDLHSYGWMNNYVRDQNAVNAKLLGGTNTKTGIMSLTPQALWSADGQMPIWIGEFGVSTSASQYDANNVENVKAVCEWALREKGLTCGYTGWHWNADRYNQLVENSRLTDRDGVSWGVRLAGLIKNTATWAATLPNIDGVQGGGGTTDPTPPPSKATESPDGWWTDSKNPMGVVNAQGERIWIMMDGRVCSDAGVDSTTNNVTAIAYWNKRFWYRNASQQWRNKARIADSWVSAGVPNLAAQPSQYGPDNDPWNTGQTPQPPPTQPQAPESPDGTMVDFPAGTSLVNSVGEAWAITAAKRITVNGTVDNTTANVNRLVYKDGRIYQRNDAGGWWYKVRSSDRWVSSSAPVADPPTEPPTQPPTEPPTNPPPTGGPTKAELLAAIDAIAALIGEAMEEARQTQLKITSLRADVQRMQ